MQHIGILFLSGRSPRRGTICANQKLEMSFPQDRPRAVLPFHPHPCGNAERRMLPGQVIDLTAYRRAVTDDALEGAWNDLVTLSDAAWTWRDPPSMEALAACVERLKAVVSAEWTGQ